MYREPAASSRGLSLKNIGISFVTIIKTVRCVQFSSRSAKLPQETSTEPLKRSTCLFTWIKREVDDTGV